MNKKGFTLVELLAVIVILALIGLLTSTSITKLVKDSKEDLNNSQIMAIKSAAQIWGADNINKLPEDGECIYITLKTLKENGLLDNVKDLNLNGELSDDLKIKISSNSNKYGIYDINYEVNSTNVLGCDTPFFCTIVSGSGKDKGDEISCGNEHFYVINNNGTTINLLAKYNLSTSVSPYKQDTSGANNPISFWESSPEVWPENGSDVYNNTDNLIKPYIETYKNYLINTVGMSVINTRLMTYDEAKYLGFSENNINDELNLPEEMYSPSYYLGTFNYYESNENGEMSFFWAINGIYLIGHTNPFGDYFNPGIRPVITISTDDLF